MLGFSFDMVNVLAALKADLYSAIQNASFSRPKRIRMGYLSPNSP